MSSQILVLNAGSSSIKFAVFNANKPLQRTVLGMVSGIGSATAFSAHDDRGPLSGTLPPGPLSHEDALAWLFAWLEDGGHARHLLGAGHRVVHGGEHHDAPIVIDETSLSGLQALAPLAPLHQPHNLAAIQALRKLRPELPQVACFDTAFHRSQPAVAQSFALPRAVTAQGLRRCATGGTRHTRGWPGHRRPSWQRRQPVRDASPSQHRHHHGFQHAGWTGHGHALRLD